MISEIQSTMIVLKHTLERNRTGVLWWTLGVAIYTVINIAAYPSFKDSILLQTQNYPQAMIEAFGLQNLDQIGPYIYAQVFLMLPLVLAFMPITAFAGAIAGAEERGGLDVLLTQPIKRRTLVLSTWMASALGVLFVLVVTGVLSWLLVKIIGEDLSVTDMALATWSVYPVTITVGSIGLLLSAAMRNRGAVLGAGIAITFLLYLMEVIGKLVKELDGLRWISPFRYFNDVFTYDIPVWHYALLIAVASVLLAASIRVFDRRDIFT